MESNSNPTSGGAATDTRPSRPFGWPTEEESFGDLESITINVDVDGGAAASRERRVSRAVGTNTGTAIAVREGYVPFGGGTLALPEHYSITVDDRRWPVCHLEVTVENGVPRCSALRCERRAGEPALTGEMLARIPVEFFLKKSAAAAAVRCA